MTGQTNGASADGPGRDISGGDGEPGGLAGNEAIRAAAERAEHTRDVNRPQWDGLPVADDTANLRLGPELHDGLLSLLPLVGVWRGEGEMVDPAAAGPVPFGQQITVAHDGRPFLIWEARSWLLEAPGGTVTGPATRESGFWRPQSDGTIELLLTHDTGVVEVYYGTARTLTSWELHTDAVARTASARQVVGSTRLYGIVDGGDLAYVDERAMDERPLAPYMSARLQRIVG